MKYVSLLNTGFSGSTLVSMMLTSQPGVIGFGDTYFSPDPAHIPRHPCTCGQWYDKCEPRANARDAIHTAGLTDFEWPSAAAVPVPGYLPNRLKRFWPLAKSASLPYVSIIPDGIRKRLFAKFYRTNRCMIDGLEQSGRYSTYLDGCKDLVRFELLQSVIPDIRILHIVRHPGAYLYHFHKSGDTQYDLRLGHWDRYNRQCRTLSSRVAADHYFPVTYEEIVKQPDAFLVRFADFIGADNFDLSDPGRLHRDKIHVIGNRMREEADRVLDFSNTWRGKLPAAVEARADELIQQDDWFKALYEK